MIEKGRSKIQIILVSRVITIWTFSGWAALAAAFSFVAQPDRINSCPAFKNKRLSVKLKIMSKNPAYFKRSYRLDRVDFMDLLSNIRPCIEYNELTNAVISVSLLIHSFSLRMLAGGSYLDICFGCRISTSQIYQIFWRVLGVMCWVSVCVCRVWRARGGGVKRSNAAEDTDWKPCTNQAALVVRSAFDHKRPVVCWVSSSN